MNPSARVVSLSIFLFLFSLVSCKKDDSSTSNSTTPPSEPPLLWTTVLQTTYPAIFSDVALAPSNQQVGIAVGVYDTLVPDPNLTSVRLMIWRTTDAGQTWQRQFTMSMQGLLGTHISVAFSDNQNCFVVGSFSTQVALKSTDAGASWTNITLLQSLDYLIDVSFFNSQIGYITGRDALAPFGSDGVIYQTNNGGQTWTRRVAPMSAILWSIHAISTTRAIAVGDGGTFKTTDGGSTWSRDSIATALVGSAGYVFFSDQLHGLILSTGFLRTSDGGTSWLTFSLPDNAYGAEGAFVGNNGQAALVIDGQHIYRSSDWGSSWQRERSDQSNLGLNSVWILDNQVRIAVGATSGGFPGGREGIILRDTQ